jgi:uncharacterized repeat protein (TIGR01451 family)
MNIKNSKKIVPATVFAAIIVLLAFSVMSTTVSAQDNLVTTLFPVEGDLGDVVDVRIDVTKLDDVTALTVNVVDTLPAEFTYKRGTFTVNDNAVHPDVNAQEISYIIDIIDNIDKYTIKFKVTVTKDYLEDRNVENVVVGTWYDDNGGELETITVTAEFNIEAQDNELATNFDSSEGNLGDVRKVTIDVTNVNDVTQRVNVVDTLPAEFTYIDETFTVNGEEADPTVDEQVISYNIINPDVETTYTIEFNVKVTKAYWENRNVENVVEGIWYGDNGKVLGTITVTPEPEFNIVAFTDLEETVNELTEPVIGTEAAWEITMNVENNFEYDMTDTKITENFAGNLKIESIAVGDITYTFEYDEKYGTKEATVDIYKNGKPLQDNPWYLNKDGVTTPQGSLYWTGKTHKAHFAWNIGELTEDDSRDITIGVSTDKNPAGKQLYTETGDHELNSGATLKFIDEDSMQLSAVAAPIVVTAVP